MSAADTTSATDTLSAADTTSAADTMSAADRWLIDAAADRWHSFRSSRANHQPAHQGTYF